MNGHKCSFSMTEKYYSYAIIIDTVHIQKTHLTYTEPGADMVGQVVVVHLSLTLPYNKSIWLKKAKATKRMEKYTFLFPSSSAN